MPIAPTLLRPERSAHASIRGYLHQACLGVERWLGLEDHEALLCEGDEDLDRLVRGTSSGTSEQVKDLTGDAPLRVVRDTLRSFLWAWVTLRRRGETRDFVFTTTADLQPPGGRPRELDVLWSWDDAALRDEVVDQVRAWVLHSSTPEKERPLVEKAVDWLGKEDDRWAAFLDSVTWTFGAPDLDAVRGRSSAAPQKRVPECGRPGDPTLYLIGRRGAPSPPGKESGWSTPFNPFNGQIAPGTRRLIDQTATTRCKNAVYCTKRRQHSVRSPFIALDAHIQPCTEHRMTLTSWSRSTMSSPRCLPSTAPSGNSPQ